MDKTISEKAFISYLDDNDKKIEGYVDLIETNSSYVKFVSRDNEITIPIQRVLKIKRKRRRR